MERYDVIIVGGGPAGLFTALELVNKKENLNILLLEKGKDIHKRVCPMNTYGTKCLDCKPCAITSGIGGAGAFSDGKLTLTSEFGGVLDEYMPKSKLNELINYVDSIYVRFGATTEVHGTDREKIREIEKRAQAADLKLIPAVIKHLGTDKSFEIIKNMRDYLVERIDIMTDTIVEEIIVKDGQAVGVVTEKGKELLNSLREKLNFLKKKKTEILKSHGYPEDYLEPKYECNICKDTGYVNGKRCKCFNQKLINIYYKQSSIAEILQKENFSNFNFEYYSDKPYGDKPSPRANMRTIVEFALNFIKHFDTIEESLFFYGNSGLGKTFLANCIAKELLDRGKSVIYRTAPDLIEGLRINKLNPDSEIYNEYLELLKECDLLIIDDLGTEPITAFSLQEFFNILNTRLLLGKKFIISTNLPLSEIMAIYPERIYSRIFGHFKLLNFYGEDIRLKKKMII